MALTVAIDGRLRDGESGGLQQMVIGLTAGLATVADDGEAYRVLVPRDGGEWIRPYLSDRVQALPVAVESGYGRLRRLDAAFRRVGPMRQVAHRVAPMAGNLATRVPASDGTIETLGADVVHFPLQAAFRTQVPSVYQPHDLQHVHLPEYFTPLQRRVRDRRFRVLCEQAATVVTMTRWGRDDLVRHLGLSPGKIAVVPGASVLSFYPSPSETDLTGVVRRFRLPERFAFYPAQTWPHKNHLRLVEAIGKLRDEGVEVPLILAGRQTDHAAEIVNRIGRLRLAEQVRWTGFVSPIEIRTLYELAACLLFPSQFEGWGMPIVEAFEAGVPVAASDIPVIDEVAGGAALLFDPTDVSSIAEAVGRLWSDQVLGANLVQRGTLRVSELSWAATGARFRALYRAAAGKDDNSDTALLTEVFA